MKWFDRWFYNKCKESWEKRDHYEQDAVLERGLKMTSSAMVEKSYPEGQDRITFELTAAVGGRILNVRRYQDKLDRHEHQTYVIPTGEDIGSRVAKIINLELIK